jgi:flagellar hook-basal body complex protein FliE
MKTVSFDSVELPSTLSEPAAPAATDPGFGQALEAAVEKIEALQTEGDTEAQKLANGGGNLHETMLALEKADVAMRVALKVRAKLVEAYNDVMRMTV